MNETERNYYVLGMYLYKTFSNICFHRVSDIIESTNLNLKANSFVYLKDYRQNVVVVFFQPTTLAL